MRDYKYKMFKGKPTRVVLVGKALEVYSNLKRKINEGNQEYISLFNSINKKIELLKNNPQYGVHIQKDRIPKKYVSEYDVNNLWKVDLIDAYRMIYTIKGTEVEIVTVIIDLSDHKEYEKTFGYKKS